MIGKIKICLWIAAVMLIFRNLRADAQLLQDTANLNIVKQEIDFIYNLQFSEARKLHGKITTAYPDHPVGHLINGLMTYWENYPLPKSGPSKIIFEEDLRECIKISEKNSNPAYEAEYLLANLCARGFLLMYYSDNNMVMDVIPLATGTYKYLMRSFNFTTSCPDFYYFTGVYRYYRDAYPKAYPVYKPLVMLFPAGDIQTGLLELNTAAVKAVVLRAESLSLLNKIYVNFENSYSQGIIYSRYLNQLYPDNPNFLAAYLRNLLLLKSYDEAGKQIASMPEEPANRFLKAQLSIFKGILREKKYLDNKTAKEYYKKGLTDLSPFGEYGNEFAAYGYFGLSRISEANGEKHEAEMYRKEALRLAAFKKIDFDE
jgi:hypothetical protein